MTWKSPWLVTMCAAASIYTLGAPSLFVEGFIGAPHRQRALQRQRIGAMRAKENGDNKEGVAALLGVIIGFPLGVVATLFGQGAKATEQLEKGTEQLEKGNANLQEGTQSLNGLIFVLWAICLVLVASFVTQFLPTG
eukprot:Skav213617  [mRNA]  locus=scaffold2986:329818:330228:+ [translate_table: standard]